MLDIKNKIIFRLQYVMMTIEPRFITVILKKMIVILAHILYH